MEFKKNLVNFIFRLFLTQKTWHKLLKVIPWIYVQKLPPKKLKFKSKRTRSHNKTLAPSSIKKKKLQKCKLTISTQCKHTKVVALVARRKVLQCQLLKLRNFLIKFHYRSHRSRSPSNRKVTPERTVSITKPLLGCWLTAKGRVGESRHQGRTKKGV